MHELPITESILEIALRHARQANARRVTTIYLVIGQMATIIDDSVQFYWDIIAKDSIAEGAQLLFKRIPASIQCQVCSLRYSPNQDDFSCPDCGSSKIKVVSGDEFYLEAIDVE
jgi:hydrogenase nickel incorporation protein HypA/HybF